MDKKDFRSLIVLVGGILAGWTICMVILVQYIATL